MATVITFDSFTGDMEPILSIAVIMIWLVAVVITYLTYLGFDVRSRGFECSGFVAATLPVLGITVRDYYRKKADHPVVDEELASKARMFRILTFVTLAALVVIIILVFIL